MLDALSQPDLSFGELSKEAQDQARYCMEKYGLFFWDANDDGFCEDGTPLSIRQQGLE